MSSLLCVKSLSGSVHVHNPDGIEELQSTDSSSSDLPKKTTFMPKPRHSHGHPRERNAKKRGSGGFQAAVAASYSSIVNGGGVGEPHGRQSAVDPSHIMKTTANWTASSKANDPQLAKETEAVRSLCTPLLDTEKTFVHDVHQYLDQAEHLALRKKELLHKTWSSQVYQPLRRGVLTSVNGPQYADKDRRHRELYRQYLEYTNKKGFVFLDTMDKGEYYAQALNGHRPAPITVHTPALQDPLLLQGRERSKEDQTILRCTTGEVYPLSDIQQIRLPTLPLVPLGRHCTDSLTWLDMPLGNIVSTPRKASRPRHRQLRMKGNCTESQIDFDQWFKATTTPTDPALIDRELKSQKKRMFVNTPPFDQPPRPMLKPPFAVSKEVKFMCPVSA